MFSRCMYVVLVTISITMDTTISLFKDKSTIGKSIKAPKSLFKSDKIFFKII